jgi:hypothetical protein
MSQDATPARHAAEHESDENFKRFVAFLLTTMIIVAAVVTVLQTRAGARASRWSREAQAYALRAMGLKTSGQAVVDYGWQGAYQQWTTSPCAPNWTTALRKPPVTRGRATG